MKIKVYVWKFVSEIADNQVLMRAAEYEEYQQIDSEGAAEHAFHIFNAPEECLEEKEIQILGDYHKRFPSLSTGDYVKAGNDCFLCKSIGWEKVNVIPEGKIRTMEERRAALLD